MNDIIAFTHTQTVMNCAQHDIKHFFHSFVGHRTCTDRFYYIKKCTHPHSKIFWKYLEQKRVRERERSGYYFHTCECIWRSVTISYSHSTPYSNNCYQLCAYLWSAPFQIYSNPLFWASVQVNGGLAANGNGLDEGGPTTTSLKSLFFALELLASKHACWCICHDWWLCSSSDESGFNMNRRSREPERWDNHDLAE